MAKFGIGQAVRRVEDQRFLQGLGRYVDDISLPGLCHGVTLLSPHAHARIKRVDVAKAKAAPGVLAVLTGADAVAEKLGSFTAHLMPEDFGAPKGHRTFQPVLVAETVRFVGDRVAFVVAETLAQARDAAELIEIDYEPLPAVVNLEDAAKDGAPKVWDDNAQGNVGFRLMFGNKDATDAAFAKAKHVVKLRVENNRLSPVTMEPRVAIGDYDAAEDHYTLYAASQNPHGARMEMSHVFHVPENQIRVVSPDVGGGFGLKSTFPDDALVLWASRRIRRPVKWVASRSESMLTDHSGREMVYYGELALDEHGKILALRARCLFQLGAYFVGAALAAGAFSVRFIPAAYDIQTLHIMSQGLFTNTSQSGPYRGAGRPEAAYFIERLIEHAARTIGMEPAEIRRRNLIPPEQAALRDADLVDLRQRRVPAADGQVHRAQRLEGFRGAQEGLGEERQAARPRGQLLHRVRRHLQRAHGPALRSRRRRSPCWAARIRTARATPPCSRSSCTTGSACRSRPSATCRATPRRSRSAAAPMRHAAPPSAAMRSMAAADAHHREGQVAGRRDDGGGRRRHRVQGRTVPRRRHRQGDSRSSTSPRPPMRRPDR